MHIKSKSMYGTFIVSLSVLNEVVLSWTLHKARLDDNPGFYPSVSLCLTLLPSLDL